MTKTEIIANIAATTNLPRAQVGAVLDALAAEGAAALRAGDDFAIPGVCKLVLHKKPPTKARDGINPFTKEPMRIQAKPARNVVKARIARDFSEAATAARKRGR